FPHGGIRQAHHRKSRQPARDVRLHRHRVPVQAGYPQAVHRCIHAARLPFTSVDSAISIAACGPSGKQKRRKTEKRGSKPGPTPKIRLTRTVWIGIFMIVKQNYPKYFAERKAQVFKMYKEMYERWLAYDLDDADLKPELEKIQGDDAAIQDRFAVALKFGTAGLRGVIGAGTN